MKGNVRPGLTDGFHANCTLVLTQLMSRVVPIFDLAWAVHFVWVEKAPQTEAGSHMTPSSSLGLIHSYGALKTLRSISSSLLESKAKCLLSELHGGHVSDGWFPGYAAV